ncbi:MAG: D-glycerate dehydrogenase [Desulfobacteraceae bacterium]|nr:D-glycerate dehydrogenase [Desulfobacteraceae bacterium]
MKKMDAQQWRIENSAGKKRVIVTKELPGRRWIEILARADCRVEISTSTDMLTTAQIKAAIGNRCDGAIGQLTESWGKELFGALNAAGANAYSNYAVGFNNVDLDAAAEYGIQVGNTPGVLTETTAEMAVALTFAAARRTGEAERYLRAGRFTGWLPSLFLGKQLKGKTVGLIGAGRIGSTYGRMMAEGVKTNLLYYSLHTNQELENYIKDYSTFLVTHGQDPLTCRRVKNIETLLQASDCVSIHTVLDDSTHHLINAQRLALMKPDALLINTSRGPVIDEAALVDHCRTHPDFRAGLDVFEQEPKMASGLDQLDNVVIVPHIASATGWTRQGMAILAAANVAGLLLGYPLWGKTDITPFLEGDNIPKAIPGLVTRSKAK